MGSKKSVPNYNRFLEGKELVSMVLHRTDSSKPAAWSKNSKFIFDYGIFLGSNFQSNRNFSFNLSIILSITSSGTSNISEIS